MKPRQIHRGTPCLATFYLVIQSSFNEAPANSPGNPLGAARKGHGPPLASMKPRQIHRGTAWRRRAVGRSKRGFNEAPANSPGNRAAG